MRLLGRIEACSVGILADSGSTHNFLDPLVIQTTKFKIHNESSLQVRVANGDSKLSKGKCEEIIRIQESKFIVPFHVLTLGDCDIVLGIQWLKTLAPLIGILLPYL